MSSTKGSVMRGYLLFALGVASASIAHAGYHVTGPVEGTVCSGVIIQSCSKRRVDAVEGENGQLHHMKRYFEEVSSYSQARGRCGIVLKSGGIGVLKFLADKARLPNFYEQVGDRYERIDVESLSFNCRPD